MIACPHLRPLTRPLLRTARRGPALLVALLLACGAPLAADTAEPLAEGRALVEALDLQPHPEGGFFRQTYKSQESIATDALPGRYDGPRAHSTSIYYLLLEGQVSRLHTLKSDEVWHFYRGAPLELVVLSPEGTFERIVLGDPEAEVPVYQYTVPHGHHFGARSLGAYSLVGCTVAPGFDFADFAFSDAEALRERFPDLSDRLEPFLQSEGAEAASPQTQLNLKPE